MLHVLYLVYSGTGNGMAKSLLNSVGEPCKASYATLAIIRGSDLPIFPYSVLVN